MRREPTPYGLRFLGGRLCLDFVNSVENRDGNNPEDFLTSYADLVIWARQREVLNDHDADRLLAAAADRQDAARNALTMALAFREALHRVFRSLATGDNPSSDDLAEIQSMYARAVTHARLRQERGQFGWTWSMDSVGLQLEQFLWPIAFSAVELLIVGARNRVKRCANPDGCGWLFYDSSKNGSRRWCSMEGCGSQVKMRRQYAKRTRRDGRVNQPAS